MANMRLKKLILEAVENQLQMDEPKCTRETLERLMAKGIGRQQAMERIAGAMLEDMYHMLKDKEPFNEEKYARRLSDLK